MKKITTLYWRLSKFPDLNIEHKAEYPYSYEKRNELVDMILDKGYSVMLRSINNNLIIWIDKYRFGQR